jgi:hypothetical protein
MGVLMVTPDFTSVSSSSAQHFRKLDPYHIEVDGDARNTYKYWIEHASGDMNQEDKDKEFAVINKVSVITFGHNLSCYYNMQQHICSIHFNVVVH